ncbi:hypothetical protein OG539_32585 [Actinacidiphila glaucinigra]|uniref:hypothetical protein n=1 Tax=Actinacidiphila glaucinigra TaxID=235986 RepID=UPI003252667D
MSVSTINARRLLILIERTQPHMAGDHVEVLNGIRFDYDGGALHAVATDRFTIAVARARLRSKDEAWNHTVAARDLRTIVPWLAGHDGSEYIHIETEGSRLTLASNRGTLVFTAAPADNVWPEWRGLFRTAMNAPLAEVPFTVLDTRFMARWQDAGTYVRVWQSEATKPYIIIGDDFLGMQMPARARPNAENETRDEILKDWAGTLGEGNEPLEMATPDDPSKVAEMVETTLQRSLAALQEAHTLDMTTEREGWHRLLAVGIYGWMAYRFLDALKQADPELAEETARDLGEQLESGEIGEWAWDAAEQAGHNPQEWHDEFEAYLKERAEKKAADTPAA